MVTRHDGQGAASFVATSMLMAVNLEAAFGRTTSRPLPRALAHAAAAMLVKSRQCLQVGLDETSRARIFAKVSVTLDDTFDHRCKLSGHEGQIAITQLGDG